MKHMFIDASQTDDWYYQLYPQLSNLFSNRSHCRAFQFFFKFAARTSRLAAHLLALQDF
jgi:hypothetical protein